MCPPSRNNKMGEHADSPQQTDNTMIKMLIDCFGGDHSPEANVDGALAAMTNNPDLYLILTGD